MKIKLRNRLDVLMKDSGVSTYEEMSRRLLENQNFKLTRSGLSRKFRDEDVALSLRMIEAICNELQCLPGDLFETQLVDVEQEFLDEIAGRLMPFRYGQVRMKHQGVAAPTTGEDQAIGSSSKPSKSTQTDKKDDNVVAIPSKYDDVTGPKVSHLSIDQLNK